MMKSRPPGYVFRNSCTEEATLAPQSRKILRGDLWKSMGDNIYKHKRFQRFKKNPFKTISYGNSTQYNYLFVWNLNGGTGVCGGVCMKVKLMFPAGRCRGSRPWTPWGGQSGMRAYTCATRKTGKKCFGFFKRRVTRFGVQKHHLFEIRVCKFLLKSWLGSCLSTM